MPRIVSPAEISKITDTLATGRYALACVQARGSGQPLPELRVPCFFNPQHGPSVTDVMWTQPRCGTRTVPACAQDAARVANREAPEVRMVKIGPRTIPYWEAGDAYLPYGRGYFPAGGTALIWAFDPSVSSAGHEFGGAGGYGGDYSGGAYSGGAYSGGYDGGDVGGGSH